MLPAKEGEVMFAPLPGRDGVDGSRSSLGCTEPEMLASGEEFLAGKAAA